MINNYILQINNIKYKPVLRVFTKKLLSFIFHITKVMVTENVQFLTIKKKKNRFLLQQPFAARETWRGQILFF